jgi:hypothetical protein
MMNDEFTFHSKGTPQYKSLFLLKFIYKFTNLTNLRIVKRRLNS